MFSSRSNSPPTQLAQEHKTLSWERSFSVIGEKSAPVFINSFRGNSKNSSPHCCVVGRRMMQKKDDDNNKKSKREILAISSSGFVFRFYLIEYLIAIGSHKRRCAARWLRLGTSKPDTVAVARWCANNVNPTTTTAIVNIVMEKVFVLLFLRVYRFAKRTAKSGSLAKRKEHEAWSQSLATNKTNHTIPFIFET